VLAVCTACVQSFPLGENVIKDPNRFGLTDKRSTPTIVQSAENSLSPGSAKVLYSALDKGTLWGPIRAHLQLTTYEEHQPAVQEQINWFTKNPAYLNDAIDRAVPYIHYIYTEVIKRNLPTELVLLPIIESGYNPSATNLSSGATGLWQLISSTARGYGVHQDRSFDGRRDLYSSTNAALNYLTYLKSFFGGDWLLAIAAYDTGEGNVQRAIRHNAQHDRNTHFWALPLVLETRSYIPRLLALAAIVKNPAKYGVSLPPISIKPYLALVGVQVGVQGTKLNLTHAAKLAGVNLSELKQLNPGVKNSLTPLTHGQLALPIDRVALYQKQLSMLLASNNANNKRTVIKQTSRQTTTSVMQQVSTEFRRFSRFNTLQHASKRMSTVPRVYLVKQGDTLVKIAKYYHVTVKNLQYWNQLATDRLRPGKKLKIMFS